MEFENIRKVINNVTSTTVKKTSEQVKITKLDIEKKALEHDMSDVFEKIGAYVCDRAAAGDAFDETLTRFIGEAGEIKAKITELQNSIEAHRVERDSAEYCLHFENEPEGEAEEVVGEATEDIMTDEVMAEKEAAEAAEAEAAEEPAPAEEAPAESETPDAE